MQTKIFMYLLVGRWNGMACAHHMSTCVMSGRLAGSDFGINLTDVDLGTFTKMRRKRRILRQNPVRLRCFEICILVFSMFLYSIGVFFNLYCIFDVNFALTIQYKLTCACTFHV